MYMNVAKTLGNGHPVYPSMPPPTWQTNSHPVLCDFSEARLRTDLNIHMAQPLPYRAPEVILGMRWNEKVDIWNLGVLVRVVHRPLRPLYIPRIYTPGTGLAIQSPTN